MYQASAAFHDAAMADAQARLLMQFADGTFLTGEDMTDIEITYPLNEDTDLTVGKCVSAELRTTVLNYHGLLSGFGFGDCAVSLGAPVGTDAWAMPEGKAAVVYRYGTDGSLTFAAQEAAPYLTVDGGEANAQPPFSPDCLVIVGDTLYAGSEDGAVWAAGIGSDGTLTALGGAATWEELSAMTWQQVADKTWGELMQGSVSAFLAHKLSRWAGRGMWFTDGACYEFSPDGVGQWEYVPLGTFHIDTPTKRKVATISCEALDGMQKFNVDADDWWAGLTWPMTRGELLARVCDFVGVTLGTATFLGSDISIPSAPIAGNGLTGKDVLGWIAESAASYARMSRAGALELVWFTAQDVTLAQNQHFGDAPAEYTTPAITALHVMVMNSDLGVVVPDEPGDNEYQIMDNPLLYGSTEADIKPLLTPIYDRLAAFAAYAPNSVEAVCDWALEAGDIIQVTGGDGETRTLPIFRMVLRWAGGGVRATYECTGGTWRKPAPSAKRKEFALYRAYHKLEVDITGIHSEIGDVKGNVANLEITAGQLQTTVAGKIDETEARSLITQTVDKISLEVSSGSGGSSFVLKSDGVAISSQTVDLHVNALNVDGEIRATSVDFDTANISGTLSAAYIDVDSLTVKNANIESLYASKIIGGSGTGGGYVPYGAVSDASHALDSVYVDTLRIMGGSNYSIYAALSPNGIAAGGKTISWADLVNGGGAVFG
ncbi:MAG: hypothetical protein SPE18_10530 [Candidatus Limivicinus sp.]|nr:hypothetical protein [Candidatus Limivicinus sp.]